MIRPHDINGLTNVNIELKLLQIDLDEKYQELISTVWIEMVRIYILIWKYFYLINIILEKYKSWTDERLSWDPSVFSNIKKITLDVNKIWVFIKIIWNS